VSTPGDLLNALGREARRLAGGRDAATPRVFRGRTVGELIPRIERDLGPEAIVVRRREGLTGGVFGFFQHPWVEIEAVPGGPGVDLYDEPDSVAPPAATETPSPPPRPASPAAAYRPSPSLPAPAAGAPAPAPAAPPAPPDPRPAAAGFEADGLLARDEAPAQAAASPYLTGHLAALARAAGEARSSSPPPLVFEAPIRSLAPVAPPRPALDFHALIPEQTRRPAAPIAPAPPDWTARAAPERRTVQPGSHARARAGVEKGLARYGIGEQLAAELIDAAMAHALPLAPRSGLAAAVRSTLAQRIPVAAPLSAQGASIVLVGAGGAGKTTCCAALLGAYRTASTLPAAFATITRAGEGEELRLLMSPQLLKPVPVESPRALRALRRARAGGLAVLDTPRVSPADRRSIRVLGRLLGELEADRVLLALPATLGRAAAAQLLEALAPLKAHALVVTHAEETDQIGVAVEVACRFGLAPEYMLAHARAGGWSLRRLDPSALAGMVLP
jgi:SRP54-type protein, GTPase domain